jgi:Ca-activated chloride channel family protein
MSFASPELLLGLLLVPLALLFYAWAQRRRTRFAVRFTNLDLLANLAPRRPAWRRHVPPALYLVAISALLLGMARPSLVLPVPREDAAVILAMDVSGSMLATDVSPTRLEAAKSAARTFLDELPDGIRVGLVTFSSQPATLVEPTADRGAVLDALDRLRASGGTAMGDGLMRSLDLAEQVQAANAADGSGTGGTAAPSPAPSPAPSAGPSGAPADGQSLVATILLSDGANSVGETEPLAAAERAATLGVPIYTIALGTPDGRVEVTDRFGQATTLDVPPDTATLAAIAETTGGAAFEAPTAEDLRAVYANLESRIGTVPEEQEVTALFAAGALAFIVVGGALTVLWFGRLP